MKWDTEDSKQLPVMNRPIQAKIAGLVIAGWIAAVFALCYAISPASAELTKEQVCAQWTQNAMLGATNAMRGTPRKIVPLVREGLEAAIEHNLLYGPEGIYVWAEDFAENPGFILDSTFFGYDYMVDYLARNGNQLPPADETATMFFGVCMERNINV